MTDWLFETVQELQNREAQYRGRQDDSEYWDHVANGLSEALEVLQEAERKRSAENMSESGGGND